MRTYEGEFTIEQAREKVWAFVIDPHKMGTCIPDLIELNVESETRFRTLVKVGVGPIRGKFDLTCELTVTEPGSAASLAIRGGGMGSGVDMKAEMSLSDVPGGTLLKWRCEAVVSGPIASLGGRLIDGEARKITEKVFANLKNALLASAEAEAAVADGAAPDEG
ncbi:MAG: carbon monoxide dehydrogenase subunit G [Alicyclobacillaceae bacterium]|nr:carbon monoxide dehydrogenase subunit G [Alicyclobacillaceae bacterium]